MAGHGNSALPREQALRGALRVWVLLERAAGGPPVQLGIKGAPPVGKAARDAHLRGKSSLYQFSKAVPP